MKPALIAALLLVCGIFSIPAPLPAALRSYHSGTSAQAFHARIWAYHGIRGKVRKWTRQIHNTYNRNGKPETVLMSKSIHEYDATGRELAQEQYGPNGRISIMRYDEDGRLTLWTTWNEDGSLKEDVRYRHLPDEDRTIREDAEGRLLGSSRTVHDKDAGTQTDYGYDAVGKPVYLVVVTRDGHGRVSKEQDFYHGRLNSETLYSYDVAGNTTRISFERDSTSGLLRRAHIMTTDAEGRVLLDLKCDGEGRVKEYEALQYDKNKQVDYTIRATADGKVLEESQAFFDGEGRCVRTLSLRDGRTGESHYRYDAAGKLVETVYTGSGEKTYRHSHRYNPQGLLTETWIHDGTGTLLNITRYAYDAMGSRIRRASYKITSADLRSTDDPATITADTIPSQFETNEIEYHE